MFIIIAPLKSAFEKSVSDRFAPEKLASCNRAYLKFVLEKIALPMDVFSNMAPEKFAFWNCVQSVLKFT
ncbi:hypothetical protein D3C76_1859020 [compost metagenome]